MPVHIVATILLVMSCSFYAAGQHGDAESGYYPNNFQGDTWTGEMSSFNQAAGFVALKYEHRGKLESFTGVLRPPVEIVDDYGDPVPGRVHLKVGDRITVYYIKQRSKPPADGYGHESKQTEIINSIFKIKLLDAEKH